MNQRPLRLFVSYAGNEIPNEPLFQRLIEDLRAQYVEMILDDSHSHSETEMLGELQRCERFMLLPSREALISSHVGMVTSVAIALIHNNYLQGIRFLVTHLAPNEFPAEWTSLPIIDATQDYTLVHAQLVQFLTQEPLRPSMALPSGSLHSSTSPAPSLPVSSLPSSSAHYTASWEHEQASPLVPPRTQPSASFPWRVFLIISLLVLTVFGVPLMLATLFTRSFAPTTHLTSPPVPIPAPVGTAYFTSSNLLNATATQGMNDGLQMDLTLTLPHPGNQYYVWLLADVSHVEAVPRLLGQFSTGTIHASYQDPTHSDLLATYSRFLVTEESRSNPPDLPSPDTSTWRYFAAIPQQPNPKDMDHYSMLDHLRHLLVAEPHLLKHGIQAGLGLMLLLDTRKILEWASAARGIGQPQGADLMHRHFIRILDFLDGPNIQKDLPANTPVLARDPFGLLTLNPMEDPPGYVEHVNMHVQALASSPGATRSQQVLANEIDTAINAVNENLIAVRKDAKTLFQMRNAQLLDPRTVPILDDLVNQAEEAYIGRLDVETGQRYGGVIWTNDRLQHLAAFSLRPYNGVQASVKFTASHTMIGQE